MIIGNDYGLIPPKLLQTIQDIYTSNSRMITLVNDLLDVARIDEMRVQDKPEEISLEEVIQSVLDEKKTDLEKKNIKVNYVSTNDPKFRIMVDPKTFRQTVDNIISNAIKYNINNGGISIFVEYLYPDIKLTFIDSGIGIPKDDLRKITNKFFRASNAISSETEGSGLGLFVVKSYVEGWGGKIDILSKEGTGTTVIIYIPTQPKVHTLDKHLSFNK
jgi:signal transduction histidine kinase